MNIDKSPRVFAMAAGLPALMAVAMTASAAGKAVRSPEVTHTGKAPTGYAVTFRYPNAAAKKVQIRGEWYFARPSELPQLAATPDHPVIESQGILPAAWQPGDFPLAHPNSTGGNWPTLDMKRGADGVWSLTLPLPSGTFSYSFLVDCNDAAPAQCTRIADPANRPWNEAGGVLKGSQERSSQVYVPADANFHTIDHGWQAAAKLRGKLESVSYASPGHVTPKDQNWLVVYTPPNYNPTRSKPYPTLYLSHGGGGNEMNWSTTGVAGNILDNLINSGEIQPLVVVMPNAGGYTDSALPFEAYDRDLIDRMIPWVEQHYHVSKSAMDRAFSGLSMGGMLTNTFMLRHPEVFQYYGMMSAGLPPENATLTPEQIAALQGKAIWIGGGWQDTIHVAGFKTAVTSHTGPAREVSTFARAGIPVTTNFVHGGHEWSVWRILLRDFLARTAFLPTPFLAAPAAVPAAAATAAAAPTRLVVPLMVDGAIHQIEPLLHARTGAPVKVEYTSMAQIIQRLNNGEQMDVTVISKAGAQTFADKGLVQSRRDLIQADVGIAVADNAPVPVLKTSADMIAFLNSTPSIAYFMPGASGNLLLQFAEKNGLSEMLKSKATVISDGFTSALVRDGRTASAIQQISELMAGGAKNIVPLPDSIQVRATTQVVVFKSAQHPEVAEQVAQLLTSPDAAAVYSRSGLIPIFQP